MVSRNVVTISKQAGCGGDEIALKVSRILGYAYFDKSLMVDLAKSLGVSEEDIVDFSEDDYRVQGFVEKILRRKRPVATSIIMRSNTIVRKSLDEEEVLSLIQTVINSLAKRGKAVIVGRGGQAILKDEVGVLHVRIVAPLAVRVKRIVERARPFRLEFSQEDALKLIEDSDKATAEYLRRFYNIDWEDPTMYEMVLNTGKMDLSTAAKIIASLARKQ
jgi:cytidylate kinase